MAAEDKKHNQDPGRTDTGTCRIRHQGALEAFGGWMMSLVSRQNFTVWFSIAWQEVTTCRIFLVPKPNTNPFSLCPNIAPLGSDAHF